MIWRLAILALMILNVAPAAEMPASKPDVRKAVVAIIDGQLAAFRKGDVPRAHALAAEALRAQKPLPAFQQIVEQNYPEIWKNVRADYGIVRDDGSKAAVTVRVYSKAGDASYDYTLAKEREGWRVLGVLRHEPKKAGSTI